jgi:transcriptional regulator with XRE-family HTH domain
MPRKKENHLSPEVSQMGRLMKHIRTAKKVRTAHILTVMELSSKTSLWEMETGQTRQSFADLVRFAAATQTDVTTNLIASMTGNFDVAIDGASNHFGRFAIDLVDEIHRRVGSNLAQLDISQMKQVLLSEVARQTAGFPQSSIESNASDTSAITS